MNTEIVQTLTSTFEAHAQQTDDGVEYWLERGIRPETLPAVEDVKKVERRLASEEKKALKKPDGLGSSTEE